MWSYGIPDEDIDEDIEDHLEYCQEEHPDVEFEVAEMTQEDLDNVYKGE